MSNETLPAEEKAVRMFPMQVTLGYNREGGSICEPVYMAAYEVYCHVWAPQYAMIDFDKGCRGGFSSAEILSFLYARSFPKSEWRARVDEALRGMKGLK